MDNLKKIIHQYYRTKTEEKEEIIKKIKEINIVDSSCLEYCVPHYASDVARERLFMILLKILEDKNINCKNACEYAPYISLDLLKRCVYGGYSLTGDILKKYISNEKRYQDSKDKEEICLFMLDNVSEENAKYENVCKDASFISLKVLKKCVECGYSITGDDMEYYMSNRNNGSEKRSLGYKRIVFIKTTPEYNGEI